MPPSFELPPYQPPTIDPAIFDALGPKLITLGHDVHVEQFERDHVRMTGVIRNPEPHRLEHTQVQIHLFDAEHRLIATQPAVVACPRLAAMEVCGWVLDAALPRKAVHANIEATAERGMLEQLLIIDAHGRFDAKGRPLTEADGLRLNVRDKTLTYPGPTPHDLLEVWASVTALDERGEVVDVAITRWHDAGLLTGPRSQRIEWPRRKAASFDVRVRGLGGA